MMIVCLYTVYDKTWDFMVTNVYMNDKQKTDVSSLLDILVTVL